MPLISQRELEQLFKDQHKSLSNLALNLVKDKDVAKDVIQEVFLKLWQNRERIDFGDQITHYLTKATVHTALNHLRSTRKLTSLNEFNTESLHYQKGHEDYDYIELERKVREAVDKLPPKCKTIYLLSRHEGLKYQEIADTLELSVKTVENQMGIALEKLRQELKPFLFPVAALIALISGVIFWIFF